ncbi:MAG: hypothetical protein QM696_09395 [Steroidobacteraceae bacterium]
MDDSSSVTTTVAVDPKLVSWVKLIYALHAVSIAMGIFGQALVATMFVFGLPSLVAVVMCYVKRDEAQGTWLASHFRWLIRTFWIAFVAVIILGLIFGPLSLLLIGIPFLFGGLAITGIWAAYRIVRGWMALADGKALPNGGA